MAAHSKVTRTRLIGHIMQYTHVNTKCKDVRTVHLDVIAYYYMNNNNRARKTQRK